MKVQTCANARVVKQLKVELSSIFSILHLTANEDSFIFDAFFRFSVFPHVAFFQL